MDEVDQSAGRLRAELPERRDLLEEELRESRRIVRGREGCAAREAFVEDTAQGKEIGARVDLIRVDDLLGRHIPKGARAPTIGVGGLVPLRPASDTEVDQATSSHLALDEQDIGWLEVTVDHTEHMQIAERIEESLSELDSLGERKGSPCKPLREARALEPLHREIGLPTGGATMGHMTHDGFVLEGREQAGLLGKPGVLHRVGSEDLQGNRAPAFFVPGAVDDSHSAARDEALDGKSAPNADAREAIDGDRPGRRQRFETTWSKRPPCFIEISERVVNFS